MCRFSLRKFLVVSALVALTAGLWLQHRWRPRFEYYHQSFARTTAGTRYSVHWQTERDPFAGHRVIYVVILPSSLRTPKSGHIRFIEGGRCYNLDGRGLEAYRDGVFFHGKLVGGYGLSKIVIAIPDGETVEVIPLTPEDAKTLDAIEGKTLLQSKLWKSKVEPQIDRLAAPSRTKFHSFEHRVGVSGVTIQEEGQTTTTFAVSKTNSTTSRWQ